MTGNPEPGTGPARVGEVAASPAAEAASAREEAKSLADLLNDLSQQMATLVHQEIELAKAEMADKGKRLGAGAGLFAGAAIVAILGLGALVACAIAGLSEALAVWLAALIVAAVLAVSAAGLGLMGRSEVRRGSPPVPEAALESTKEDVEWLKTQVRSAKP